MLDYYPNECPVCNSTSLLSRCARCNMISYCGKQHQKMHYAAHANICKVISAILKENQMKHIFENCENLDAEKWRSARAQIMYEVIERLDEGLTKFEKQMFLHPRVCFVCRNADQNLLANCPDCPNASFCPKHPSSPVHNEICHEIEKCHDYDVEYKTMVSLVNVQCLSETILQHTPIIRNKSKILPSTNEEYLEYLKNKIQLDFTMKIFIIEFVGLPLAICNALRKINFVSPSTLMIHMINSSEMVDNMLSWEILLHFIPTLNILKINLCRSEETGRINVRLCCRCEAAKKKLIINGFATTYLTMLGLTNSEPGLVIIPNLSLTLDKEIHKRQWKRLFLDMGMFNCPMIFLYDKENEEEVKEYIKNTYDKIEISYDGMNNFTSPRSVRHWTSESMSRVNEEMLIFKVLHPDEPRKCKYCGITCRSVNLKTFKCSLCESLHVSQDAVLFPKQGNTMSQKVFYVNCCQLCHEMLETLSTKSDVSCEKCKMIFYCNKKHQREHWSLHKDLCKVICDMLQSSGSSNLFEKADKSNSQTWLQSKINLLLEAQKKLGRKLLNYEKEIFLFPKTCFICYKSNTSLKTCKCALSFCSDEHWNCEEHKTHCVELYFTRMCSNQLNNVKRSPVPIATTEIMLWTSRIEIFKTMPMKNQIEECKDLPKSMDEFIKICIKLKNKKFWEKNNPNTIFVLREMLYAEIFSKPLTLLGALTISHWPLDSMVVHVIGATNDEKSEAGFWEILLHFVPLLKNLKIIFVGPELSELQLAEPLVCEVCSKKGKKLEVRGLPLRYDEYFNHESFLIPNFVIGFNLHIHESELGITEDTWQDSILTLTKIPAPFIMTAKTYRKALMDLEKLNSYFGNCVDCDCLKLNEFRADIPSRDFETEKYETSNQFVTVFCRLYEELSSVTDDNFENERESITVNQDLKLVQKMENLSVKPQTKNSKPKSKNSEPKLESEIENTE